MENNEAYDLYISHHGIKGQKWGIRRTAAQLGHLVGTGAKRVGSAVSSTASKANSKLKSEMADRKEVRRNKKLSSKSVKDMTAAEMQEHMERMAMEKQYLDMKRNVNSLRKSDHTAGKEFVAKFMGEAVGGALISAGKSVFTDKFKDMGKKYLGMDKKDDYDVFEKSVKLLELKKREKEANNFLNKKDDADDNDAMKKDADYWTNLNRKEMAQEAIKKRAKENQNGSDDGNNSSASDHTNSSSTTNSSSDAGAVNSQGVNAAKKSKPFSVDNTIRNASINYTNQKKEAGGLVNQHITSNVETKKHSNAVKTVDAGRSFTARSNMLNKSVSTVDSMNILTNVGRDYASTIPKDTIIGTWRVDDDD